MPIHSLIAHRLFRATPTEPCQVKTASDLWSLSGVNEELFRDMKYSVLRRTGKEYGRFASDRAAFPFASWLEEFSSDKLSFVSFSQRVLQQFKMELDKTEAFLDTYMVFGHESLESDEQLHLFCIQHQSGLYIDGDLVTAHSSHLDIDGIRLAAKINITDWQSDEDYRKSNAITLLRSRGEKELSDAFAAALGFSEKRDIAAETEAFLTKVNDYTQTLPDDVAACTRKEVVDFCLAQDSTGKAVVIEELAAHLENTLPNPHDYPTPFTPPPKFDRFLAAYNPNSKPELIPDKKQMRNFVRISGRNELLSMSFASSCLGSSVIYDSNTDSLTIKNLPSSLKSKLKKHVAGTEG